MEAYVYHVSGQYGSWWDLYFTTPDPLWIQRARVVSIDGLRH